MMPHWPMPLMPSCLQMQRCDDFEVPGRQWRAFCVGVAWVAWVVSIVQLGAGERAEKEAEEGGGEGLGAMARRAWPHGPG